MSLGFCHLRIVIDFLRLLYILPIFVLPQISAVEPKPTSASTIECPLTCNDHGQCKLVDSEPSCHCFGSWTGSICELDRCSSNILCETCRSHFEDIGADGALKWGCTWNADSGSCAGVFEDPVAYNCPTIKTEREMEEQDTPSYASNTLIVGGVLSAAAIAICIKRRKGSRPSSQEYELVPTDPSQVPTHTPSKKSSSLSLISKNNSHNSDDEVEVEPPKSATSKKDWGDWDEETPQIQPIVHASKPLPDDLFEEFGMAPKPKNLSLLSLSSQMKFMNKKDDVGANRAKSPWGDDEDEDDV